MSSMVISVHSSFIKSAVYNEDKQSLRIEIGNSWYYYYGVTKQKINRFKKAASKGQCYAVSAYMVSGLSHRFERSGE